MRLLGCARPSFSFLASLLLLPLSQALHESDVGIVDWHKHLIGVPLAGTTATAPAFHHANGTSVLLTATGNNVLAALNPGDGSVVWRHVYEPEDRIAGYYKRDNAVAALSGPGGSTLRTFDTLTGSLVLEKQLHTPEDGHLSEPHHLGKHVAFSPTSQGLYVLTNGHTVSFLNETTGDTKWTWSAPDQTSLTIYSKLIATPNAIYVVGIAKSFASFTLHVTALSPVTGDVLSAKNIPSSIKEALTQFFTLSTQPSEANIKAIPRIAWLEEGSIKSVGLTPALDGRVTNVKASVFERIVDVGVCDYGHFIAVKEDGTGRVMKLQPDGSAIKSVWEFKGSKDVLEPIYAGGLDKDGNVYLSRNYWAHSISKAKVDIFSSQSGVESKEHKPLTTSLDIPFDTRTHGIIGHITLEAVSPAPGVIANRMLITTSTGALQLWAQGDIKWVREEALAATVVAEFVELPEMVHMSSRGDGDESFLKRLVRQMGDAQNFPQYLVGFVKRFATGSYASTSSPTAASDAPLARDTFGFRQIIVAATVFGKVYGIDSGDGSILWSRVLGLGWAGEVGGQVQPVKLFVTHTVGDEDGERGNGPQVVLVVQRRAENSLVDTVLFHIDALTGDEISGTRNKDMEELKLTEEGVLQGLDIISGPVVEAYLLDGGDSKIVVLLDEYLQVYLYPETPATQAAFKRFAPTLHFPLRTGTQNGQRRLLGHRVSINPSLSERYVAYSTWTMSLPEGEDIRTMIPAARGPVASVGKVLGNKTTLYKYLNPRLVILLTAPHSAPVASTTSTKTRVAACGIYLVDSAKGTVVYRTTLPTTDDGACDVKATLVENWLVYHYYDPDFNGTGQTKGWRMVSVELYEGKAIDEKTMSSDMSSYSKASADITAIEKAYVFPHAITALAATSTKFGITSKDLIVATRNHQIQSIQRRLLDPRRPNRKVTAEEQEEFLIQYDPILPYDTKRVLSHNYEVANTQRIITAPALLESTSLVFAFGLDMFLTRVAPSNTFDVLNENFNKAQLVLTVSGLALAIMITKPMVRKKRLREKWYQ